MWKCKIGTFLKLLLDAVIWNVEPYTTPKCTTLIVLALARFGLLLSSSVRWSETESAFIIIIITKA